MSPLPLVRTQSLSKNFGGDRGALDLNFQINPGEIVGFVGPNGAGKTTTLNMLIGTVHPDSGKYWLFDQEIDSLASLQSQLGKVGYLPAEPNYYNITGDQLIAYAQELYQRDDIMQRAKGLANILELDTSRQIHKLSLGNRKKVGVVQALMHNPQLVIMDEPTSGLDPLIQQRVLEMLKQVRSAGGAVFLSSHTLSEVENICDRVIMIRNSRIIIQDSTKNILERALKKFRITNLPTQLSNLIQKYPVSKIEHHGQETVIYTQNPKPILDFLYQNQIHNFYLERTSLEEMFLAEYDI